MPYDRVWCPGANECTTITLSRDVKLNGQSVAAGTYTLWARPGEKTWQMILNRAPHDKMREVARSEGMRTLQEQAIRLVENGTTTAAEVMRTIYMVAV